jgi:beta-lactamase class A
LAQTVPTASAIGQANLRAAPDINSALLGQITSGARYPIIGRSQYVPWLLLGDAQMQPIGWVFRDLLEIQGDLSSVPFTEAPINTTPPTLSLIPSPPLGAPTQASAPISASGVFGLVSGEINIRYEPRIDSARVGVARAGDRLTVLRWHTQLPWVEVAYPASPTGTAWVLLELLRIEGDLYSLPSTSQTSFLLPTLTPTPSAVEQPVIAGFTPAPISPAFRALGDELWGVMLSAGFDPATSRLGGLFVMDLRTGEALSFGDSIAFSGTSISKIGILAAYFSQLSAPPNDEQAFTIAQTMICSENIHTNRLLAAIGGGDPYAGAERVTSFLDQVGLRRSFIFTPFANDPFITPQAPRTRSTDADQTAAQPDPFNQMTVTEIGALLNSIYQCAVSETGPLLTNFDGAFTPGECRRMLHVMSYNQIGALIESGVPEDVRIAHKHGWIDDTHGDAAVVFSPGGDYILVVMLHNPTWLNFEESSAVIEEISRRVYNYFNPTAPMLASRDAVVPATCNIFGSPVIDELMSLQFDQ